MRMDGGTAIGQRNMMVDEFNSNSAYFVFLLTTKVGGLGINLQSADRVIIFDPDWVGKRVICGVLLLLPANLSASESLD
jgi:SNF2 family DNA or RNA helicase